MIGFDDTESLITLRDWLRFAVSRFNESKLFFGHGSDNAHDEAAYLILHTLHLPLDRLDPFLDASLTHAEAEQVKTVIERRVRERIPAAYLTHEAWLAEHRFYVDERVIVPRSFIAELLPGQLSPWVESPDAVTRALDLCTGSGCLGILAALAFTSATIDAVDLSRDALDVATGVRDPRLEQPIFLVLERLAGFSHFGHEDKTLRVLAGGAAGPSLRPQGIEHGQPLSDEAGKGFKLLFLGWVVSQQAL